MQLSIVASVRLAVCFYLASKSLRCDAIRGDIYGWLPVCRWFVVHHSSGSKQTECTFLKGKGVGNKCLKIYECSVCECKYVCMYVSLCTGTL